MRAATAMSHGATPNLVIATPEQIVAGAMRDFNRRFITYGWWRHCLVDWIYTCMPGLVKEEIHNSA
jgi:hypothetical protein